MFIKNNKLLSEKELIERCMKNERSAQKQLFELYSAKMLGVCYRYVGDYDTANDMLQEGFIKVFYNLDKFRNEAGTFNAWIKTIMINHCLNHLKKEKRVQKIDLEETAEMTDNNPDALASMSTDLLMKCIAELPDSFRTILNLHAFEGYSYKEISELLSISEVNIRTQIFRARKQITERLNYLNQLS